MRSQIMNRGVLKISDARSKLGSTKLAAAACSLPIMVIVSALLLTALSAHAQETVLYNFCPSAGCVDGSYPGSSLTTDGAGNFYGTSGGGATGNGTVFELSPNGVGGYNESVLYSFCSQPKCIDGSGPGYSNVIFDSSGNLYGTTVFGGASGGFEGDGTVFELSPEPVSGCPSGSNTGNGWCETVIHSFGIDGDAIFPSNGLVMDKQGNLYGNAISHAHYQGRVNCLGLIYELSPIAIGQGDGWAYKGIYSPKHENVSFNNEGLAIDGSGNLYGATGESVFELSPNGVGGFTATIIHYFKGAPPTGVPVVDSAGNLYGTSFFGGTGSCSGGCGTVWKLTPNAGKFKASTLYSFQGGTADGATPYAGVVLDSRGNIYGTTSTGGVNELGTVYELAFNGVSYQESILLNFNGTDGYDPVASLILVGGNLYGTTEYGGPSYSTTTLGDGVVFELTP